MDAFWQLFRCLVPDGFIPCTIPYTPDRPDFPTWPLPAICVWRRGSESTAFAPDSGGILVVLRRISTYIGRRGCMWRNAVAGTFAGTLSGFTITLLPMSKKPQQKRDSVKKKGKQAKGYIQGDALGNYTRACWGVPKLDPYNPPRRINHDLLRQFIYVECFDFPLTLHPRQVRFYTCKELVDLAQKRFKWHLPTNKSQAGTDSIASAKRQMRNVCRELGVKLKEAPVGRPPATR
jgi:hypothetical protein